MNLNQVEVFSGLSTQQLESIAGKVVWNKITKNTVLFSNQDHSDTVYFIDAGTVRATIYSIAGKEIAYQDLSVGEMFGELSAIDGKVRTTSIVAVTDAVIGRISSDDFWALLESHPEVMRKVMLRLTGLIRFLVGRVYEYAAMDVKDRIRAEIVRQARKNMTGDNAAFIQKMATHEEIASKIATHREAVTKEFSYLVKSGYIEKQGKSILISDLARLEELVTEEI